MEEASHKMEAEPPLRCHQRHPVDTAWFPSRHLVLWMRPLLRDGLRKPLQKEDVWPLPEVMTVAKQLPELDVAMRASKGSYVGALRRLVARRILYLQLPGQLYMLVVVMTFPLVLVAMIRWLEDPEAPLGYGLLIAAGGFVAANLGHSGPAFVHRNGLGRGAELRLQAMAALFRKALRLRAWGCGEGLVPNLITCMSVDSERIHYMMHMGHLIGFLPMLFLLTVALIAWSVGVLAGFAGAVMMLVFTCSAAKVASQLMEYRRRMQVRSAQRLVLTRQALDGIRAIKMYGWVEPLEQRILRNRMDEEEELMKYLMLRALSSSIAFLVPTIVTFTILAVAALLGRELSVEDMFVVMSLVNNLRGPLSGFPVVVGYFTDGLVSARRVGATLALPEHGDEACPSAARAPVPAPRLAAARGGAAVTLPPATPVVELSRASFAWDSGASKARLPGTALPSPLGGPDKDAAAAPDTDRAGDVPSRGLADVNLHLLPGELCCVVGPVGGGKSSLVNAVLGQMAQTAGTRVLRAPSGVAYCPQEPWIISDLLWRNIAIGCQERGEVDEDAYERAVAGAELTSDLEQLPAGDETEIGAHGINLSGGQRARVALARAIYQCEKRGCELVVLDDVLSAVDLGVARRLMAGCLLDGALATRARLVVLNSHYDLLASATQILVVADGVVMVYRDLESYKKSSWAAALAAEKEEGGAPRGAQRAAAASTSEVPPWIAAGLPRDLRLGGADEQTMGSTPSHRPAGEAPPEEDLDESGRLLVPEDRQVGLLSWGTYKLYFGHGACGCGAGFLVFVIVLIGITEAARMVCDLWVAEWAAAPVRADGQAEPSTHYWIGSYALLAGCTVVLCFTRSFVFMLFARRSSRHMHGRMLARALRAPVNIYFDTVPTSSILNRLGKDLDVVDTMLPHYLLEFFQDWMFLVGTVAVVAWKAWPVLITVPVCTYAFIRIRVCYMASSRELKRLEAVARSPVLAGLSEAMEGIASIRALRLEPAFERRFTQLAEQNATLFWHGMVLLPWLISRVDGLGSIFVLATAVSLVFLRSSITPAVGAVAFTLVLNWIAKLQWAVRQSIEAENYLTSVERCEHFERIPQELEPDDPVPAAVLAAAAERGDAPAVEFRSVSVRYRPRLPLAIKDLSFSVQPGERVGVIGRTGCGKSTLTLCLFRILEVESGEVRLFGYDVRRLTTTVLRRAIATVPQVPLVYAGSLRENLDPLAELPDDRLWEALERVGLAPLARQAAAGLDMSLAEGGSNLSVGQRQLLTIARASLRHARVVVCDEATSSCDPKTDAAVQRLLQGSALGDAEPAPFAGAAMLTIAHRLDTLATYDRVLVLTPATAASPTTVREIVRPGSGFNRGPRAARQELVAGAGPMDQEAPGAGLLKVPKGRRGGQPAGRARATWGTRPGHCCWPL